MIKSFLDSFSIVAGLLLIGCGVVGWIHGIAPAPWVSVCFGLTILCYEARLRAGKA